MKNALIYFLLILPFVGLSAQSEKTIKSHKISQRVEKVVNYEDGLTDKRTAVEQFFDKEGQLVEYKDWTKDGKIKEWMKYTYNAEGQVITETTLDAKGKVEEKVINEYNGKLKVKKSYYDGKERLIKEKFYDYKYFE